MDPRKPFGTEDPPALTQLFEPPDDHVGVFGWLCGYSADAHFLNAANYKASRCIHRPQTSAMPAFLPTSKITSIALLALCLAPGAAAVIIVENSGPSTTVRIVIGVGASPLLSSSSFSC